MPEIWSESVHLWGPLVLVGCGVGFVECGGVVLTLTEPMAGCP